MADIKIVKLLPADARWMATREKELERDRDRGRDRVRDK